MPYARGAGKFERANRLGHVSVAKNLVIRTAVERWGEPPAAQLDRPGVEERLASVESLNGHDHETTFVVAFDGSLQEVEAREEYPSIKVGYLQIAGVAVDLPAFFAARTGPFIDPRRLAKASQSQIINAALPSANIPARDGGTVTENWRREVFETFSRQGVDDFGTGTISLLDAIYYLHGSPEVRADTITVGVCPYKTEDDCSAKFIEVPPEGTSCPTCGRVVWPTDVLRTHEEFDEEGSNLTPLTRLMNSAERLLCVAYLTGFAKTAPSLLSRIAFVTDGPLAFFGTTAKLKSQMISFLSHLNNMLLQRGMPPPLLVGIEKSGLFVDHAHAVTKAIPAGYLVNLDELYIRQRVKRKTSKGLYGVDEFYGRRFFFKTTSGNTLVVTVPRISGQPYGDSPGCDSLDEYPTLRPILRLLDRIETRLYPDAVIPIALAHSAAALPLGTGSDVLQILAKDLITLSAGGRDSS